MTEILPSVAFGVTLLVLGIGLIRWHLKMWRAQSADPAQDDRDRRHYRVQLRRRIQISILMILLGVLIPVGDALMTANRLSQSAAAFWIMAMLLLALWIIMLACLDWVSSRLHRRSMLVALAGLDRKRRELEDEVSRLRGHHRNGRG